MRPACRIHVVLAAGLMLQVVAAGCSGGRSAQPRSSATTVTSAAVPLGQLEGTLSAVGGPCCEGPRPLGGTVFVESTGLERTVAVGTDGAFSVEVPAGVYTVRGRSPEVGSSTGDCVSDHSVDVVAGKAVTVAVKCVEE